MSGRLGRLTNRESNRPTNRGIETVPKTYEYQCEKHGPWVDFHSNLRATYDCPKCATEQNERYAQLYHREVVVTQLTLLSLDVSQTEVMMRTARQLAHMTAS